MELLKSNSGVLERESRSMTLSVSMQAGKVHQARRTKVAMGSCLLGAGGVCSLRVRVIDYLPLTAKSASSTINISLFLHSVFNTTA